MAAKVTVLVTMVPKVEFMVKICDEPLILRKATWWEVLVARWERWRALRDERKVALAQLDGIKKRAESPVPEHFPGGPVKPRRLPAGLAPVGPTRPSLPVPVFAEDFALLIRGPKRLRIRGSKVRVLQ